MLFRRSNEPAILELAFDAAHYRILLKRHRQARRYTLRIHTATREVVMTMPLRGTLKEARVFAEKHGGWIAARLGRLPAATPFAPDAMVPLRNIPIASIIGRPRAAPSGPKPRQTARRCCASPAGRRISRAA